jgi:hypothetical protein
MSSIQQVRRRRKQKVDVATGHRSGRGACKDCLAGGVPSALVPSRYRLTITLDGEYAVKLTRMAERVQADEVTLARSLLFRAI